MKDLERHVRVMESIAEMFSRNNLPYSSHLSNYWGRMWEYGMMVEVSNPRSGDWVLDVGGMGTLLDYYLKRLGCVVSCVDPAQVHLDDANVLTMHATEFYGIDNRIGKGQDLGFFPDGVFDCVYSVCVIEHLPTREEQTEMFLEMIRVVKPGGILGITYDYWEMDNPEQNWSEVGPFKSESQVRETLINPALGIADLYGNNDILSPAAEPGGRTPDGPGATIGTLFMRRKSIISQENQ